MKKIIFERIGVSTDWKAVWIALLLIGLIKSGIITKIPW